jgi:hypothetical protein
MTRTAALTLIAVLVAIAIGDIDELATALANAAWLWGAAGLMFPVVQLWAVAPWGPVPRARPQPIARATPAPLPCTAISRVLEPWLRGRGPPAPAG